MTGPQPHDDGAALAAMAARVRAALDGDVPDTSEAQGPYLGSAADGGVTAEVGADGTVRSLVIEPDVLKEPLDDVAAAVRNALNAALDARPGQVDFGPVVAQLRAAQEQARHNMGAITQGMADVERSIRATRERMS